ncbi:hypothetical protein BCR36DRAFT_408522 [Piromyces finnis]|uniref:Uncharacterized protein n=1 Tax=Piromyces finnis TaxID=1754191 RepID=A0A1Y1VNF1_9FUNG|nr:hypothetical protein BCR36DRAFT_408522 [Piromyces finnis]|eukprot:ORX60162.1 hypothetical protein BCR36DRAFT_408522 [Piromyces finnis]
MSENKNKIINDFDNYIQAKRKDSFNQFKIRWESIMNRYSKPILNDDVVDLFTGEIIEDHGFIKSVKPLPFGSIVNSIEDESEVNSSHLQTDTENNFTYDEDDFDNLLTPKKQTLLQVTNKNTTDIDYIIKETNDNKLISNSTNDFISNSNILLSKFDGNYNKQEVFDSIMEMGFNSNNELSDNEEIADELDLFSDIGIPSVDFDKHNIKDMSVEILESEEEEEDNNNIEVIEDDVNSIIDISDDSKALSSNIVIISDDEESDINDIFEPIKNKKRKIEYDDCNILINSNNSSKKLKVKGIDKYSNIEIEEIDSKLLNIPINIKKDLDNDIKIEVVNEKSYEKIAEVKIKNEISTIKVNKKSGSFIQNKKKLNKNNDNDNRENNNNKFEMIKQESNKKKHELNDINLNKPEFIQYSKKYINNKIKLNLKDDNYYDTIKVNNLKKKALEIKLKEMRKNEDNLKNENKYEELKQIFESSNDNCNSVIINMNNDKKKKKKIKNNGIVEEKQELVMNDIINKEKEEIYKKMNKNYNSCNKTDELIKELEDSKKKKKVQNNQKLNEKYRNQQNIILNHIEFNYIIFNDTSFYLIYTLLLSNNNNKYKAYFHFLIFDKLRELLKNLWYFQKPNIKMISFENKKILKINNNDNENTEKIIKNDYQKNNKYEIEKDIKEIEGNNQDDVLIIDVKRNININLNKSDKQVKNNEKNKNDDNKMIPKNISRSNNKLIKNSDNKQEEEYDIISKSCDKKLNGLFYNDNFNNIKNIKNIHYQTNNSFIVEIKNDDNKNSINNIPDKSYNINNLEIIKSNNEDCNDKDVVEINDDDDNMSSNIDLKEINNNNNIEKDNCLEKEICVIEDSSSDNNSDEYMSNDFESHKYKNSIITINNNKFIEPSNYNNKIITSVNENIENKTIKVINSENEFIILSEKDIHKDINQISKNNHSFDRLQKDIIKDEIFKNEKLEINSKKQKTICEDVYFNNDDNVNNVNSNYDKVNKINSKTKEIKNYNDKNGFYLQNVNDKDNEEFDEYSNQKRNNNQIIYPNKEIETNLISKLNNKKNDTEIIKIGAFENRLNRKPNSSNLANTVALYQNKIYLESNIKKYKNVENEINKRNYNIKKEDNLNESKVENYTINKSKITNDFLHNNRNDSSKSLKNIIIYKQDRNNNVNIQKYDAKNQMNNQKENNGIDNKIKFQKNNNETYKIMSVNDIIPSTKQIISNDYRDNKYILNNISDIESKNINKFKYKKNSKLLKINNKKIINNENINDNNYETCTNDNKMINVENGKKIFDKDYIKIENIGKCTNNIKENLEINNTDSKSSNSKISDKKSMDIGFDSNAIKLNFSITDMKNENKYNELIPKKYIKNNSTELKKERKDMEMQKNSFAILNENNNKRMKNNVIKKEGNMNATEKNESNNFLNDNNSIYDKIVSNNKIKNYEKNNMYTITKKQNKNEHNESSNQNNQNENNNNNVNDKEIKYIDKITSEVDEEKKKKDTRLLIRMDKNTLDDIYTYSHDMVKRKRKNNKLLKSLLNLKKKDNLKIKNNSSDTFEYCNSSGSDIENIDDTIRMIYKEKYKAAKIYSDNYSNFDRDFADLVDLALSRKLNQCINWFDDIDKKRIEEGNSFDTDISSSIDLSESIESFTISSISSDEIYTGKENNKYKNSNSKFIDVEKLSQKISFEELNESSNETSSMCISNIPEEDSSLNKSGYYLRKPKLNLLNSEKKIIDPIVIDKIEIIDSDDYLNNKSSSSSKSRISEDDIEIISETINISNLKKKEKKNNFTDFMINNKVIPKRKESKRFLMNNFIDLDSEDSDSPNNSIHNNNSTSHDESSISSIHLDQKNDQRNIFSRNELKSIIDEAINNYEYKRLFGNDNNNYIHHIHHDDDLNSVSKYSKNEYYMKKVKRNSSKNNSYSKNNKIINDHKMVTKKNNKLNSMILYNKSNIDENADNVNKVCKNKDKNKNKLNNDDDDDDNDDDDELENILRKSNVNLEKVKINNKNISKDSNDNISNKKNEMKNSNSSNNKDNNKDISSKINEKIKDIEKQKKISNINNNVKEIESKKDLILTNITLINNSDIQNHHSVMKQSSNFDSRITSKKLNRENNFEISILKSSSRSLQNTKNDNIDKELKLNKFVLHQNNKNKINDKYNKDNADNINNNNIDINNKTSNNKLNNSKNDYNIINNKNNNDNNNTTIEIIDKINTTKNKNNTNIHFNVKNVRNNENNNTESMESNEKNNEEIIKESYNKKKNPVIIETESRRITRSLTRQRKLNKNKDLITSDDNDVTIIETKIYNHQNIRKRSWSNRKIYKTNSNNNDDDSPLNMKSSKRNKVNTSTKRNSVIKDNKEFKNNNDDEIKISHKRSSLAELQKSLALNKKRKISNSLEFNGDIIIQDVKKSKLTTKRDKYNYMKINGLKKNSLIVIQDDSKPKNKRKKSKNKN